MFRRRPTTVVTVAAVRHCSTTASSSTSTSHAPTTTSHLPPSRSATAADAVAYSFPSQDFVDSTTRLSKELDAPSKQQKKQLRADDPAPAAPEYYSRNEDDPQLYHTLAPENLRYVQEDDQFLAQEAREEARRHFQQQQQQPHDEETTEPEPPLSSGPHLNEPQFIDGESIQDMRAAAYRNKAGELARDELQRQWRDSFSAAAQDAHSDATRGSGARLPFSDTATRALATERMLTQLLESGAGERVKADAAVEITSRIRRENLPLRPRIAQEVCALWERVASRELIAAATPHEEKQKFLEREERRQKRRRAEEIAQAGTAKVVEDAEADADVDDFGPDAAAAKQKKQIDANVAASIATAVALVEPAAALYFHLRKTHTAPTPLLMQHVMSLLQMASGGAANPPFMHLATRIMLDSDRFAVLCTRITYATYFDMCGLNHLMEVALTRFADAKKVLFLEADAGMVRSMVSGFIRNGQTAEALAFLARTAEVQIDIVYVNAILELLSLSAEPMAAFAAFRALGRSGLVPNSTTFYHLLRACEASGHWEHGAPLVLSEMQRLRVKGDDVTLNLLLKGLLLCKGKGMRGQYAQQLFLAMKQKRIEVFSEVEDAMPERVRARGDKIAAALKSQSKDRRRAAADPAARALSGGGGGGGGASLASTESGGSKDANSSQRRRRRDAEFDDRLRTLVAEGRLMDRRTGKLAARMHHLCAFCLRRRAGSFEDQDLMREFLASAKALRSSIYQRRMRDDTHGVADASKTRKERRKQKHAEMTKDADTDAGTDETTAPTTSTEQELMKTRNQLRFIAKKLRPILFRAVHKHFYGVAPASTSVIDFGARDRRPQRRHGGGGGGGSPGASSAPRLL